MPLADSQVLAKVVNSKAFYALNSDQRTVMRARLERITRIAAAPTELRAFIANAIASGLVRTQ